jgi:hypothetical protein
MRSFTIALLFIAVAPASGLAKDIAAADACAGKLGPSARQIYTLAAPEVKPSSVIKDILVAKIQPLVMSGKIDRNQAQADAPKAGECLKLLQ